MKHTLQKFVKRLNDLGYGEYCSCFCPHFQRVDLWPKLRENACEELQPIIDLLMLGRAVELSSLDKEIAAMVRELENYNLFQYQTEDSVRTVNYVLICVMGIWLFYELPSPRISLYFGDDSMALLQRQQIQPGKTCLDLCSGPGIQALYAARNGEFVTSVEIHPVARALAQVNAMMNGLDERLDIRLGNLYAAVEGMRFDRIMANPPLIPFPQELAYPFVGHGGTDGFQVTWKILGSLGEYLAEDGFFQTLGLGLGDGRSPLFLPKLKEVAKESGLDVLVSVVSQTPMYRKSKMFREMAMSSHGYCGVPAEQIEDVMENWLKEQGADRYVFYYMKACRGSGNVKLQQLQYGNGWYVV